MGSTNNIEEPVPPTTTGSEELQVLAGPLLNYKGMIGAQTGSKVWQGSVLIVTKPAQTQPELRVSLRGPVRPQQAVNGNSELPNGQADGVDGASTATGAEPRTISGERLYSDPDKIFWRFTVEVPIQPFEAQWDYTISRVRYLTRGSNRHPSTETFVVPSQQQSMRIMFHSCNGFSVGTDENVWTGPVLWNDVLRFHEKAPFHVMIGGGDQIYNDGVRVDGPLRPWTDLANPKKRRDYQFPETMRADCDKYYFDNYIRWYTTEPFAAANAQIPQVNIWDDHDIIDGFGSYTDHFMKCAVFRGIGGVAHKYYMLFQHHSPPPKSTFTTDAPQTMESQGLEGTGADPLQTKGAFVMTEKEEHHSWIIGPKPGPYVAERSRSVFMQLGKHIAFVGLDARTERTRHRINYPETYDLIFHRLDREFSQLQGEIKHLIVLLGVPIAYPRLQWLENIFSSPIIGPIRFLNKRFGLAGGLFNKFDGQVDLLDDLDDHYTAHQHKKERKELILRFQALSKKHSVRVTILGGDVHLAALGRFYSLPTLNIPVEQDHRYMVNIISSAITNKPPPPAVANLLARRNRIHHFDSETDETLLKMFDKVPGPSVQVGKSNHATMPSRNFAIITESNSSPQATNGTSAPPTNGHSATHPNNGEKKDAHYPLSLGEENAGTQHPAAAGLATSTYNRYGLDVALRVECNRGDIKGETVGYGLSIPALGHEAPSAATA
ncbi:hypothetical protein L228DRAFT_239238 [Xylona heveae TC161]|uniref:PhoD-like phosphatase domain-containing protein n=1 Tax=Xylona heveae (strain CBS 132557 / TC161) TaxID=1328760 RepID=A0A165GJ35_XYLHT|nr:hypothetical protein L228DRAFT_239238 [Xylona heveae TC161]KZF22247.1 hypothetical protein L228DRAFT_239238 [Xylona heveae TC161]